MVRPRQTQIEPLSGNTEGPGDSNEVISLTGDNGVIDSGGSRFTNTTGSIITEQATVPGGNPPSGHGTLWVRNDSPNVLVFTNDAGSDTVINGITSHSDLSNLSNDDHTQYLLVNGSRAMSGSLNMGSNAIGGVTTLSTSGNIISLGGVSATSNTLSHHASVPGGLPGAEAGKLWVKNNVPNVLMFTDNSGADHQLAYTSHVTPQNISEILSFGNDTDGYDIDLTNGSVITSSDGYITLDTNTIINGTLISGDALLDSVNGAIITSNGSGNNFLSNDGTYKPLLNNFINVRDYGAHPDADVTTNNNAFSNALIEALEKSVNLYIPAGSYKITSSIELTNASITIYGDGSRTQILYEGNGSWITRAIGSQTFANIIIRDIRITGTSSGIAGIDLTGTANITNILIENVRIDGFNGLNAAGIIADKLYSSQIRNCIIINNYDGIRFGATCISNTIGPRNFIRGWNRYGVAVIGDAVDGSSYENHIIENIIDEPVSNTGSAGIYLTLANVNSIIGNHFEALTKAIMIGETGISLLNTVERNMFSVGLATTVEIFAAAGSTTIRANRIISGSFIDNGTHTRFEGQEGAPTDAGGYSDTRVGWRANGGYWSPLGLGFDGDDKTLRNAAIGGRQVVETFASMSFSPTRNQVHLAPGSLTNIYGTPVLSTTIPIGGIMYITTNGNVRIWHGRSGDYISHFLLLDKTLNTEWIQPADGDVLVFLRLSDGRWREIYRYITSQGGAKFLTVNSNEVQTNNINSIDDDLQINGFILPETFSDTLTLPSEDGLNGHVLQTDGVGNLFFGPIDGYASSNIGIDTVLSNNSDANGQEIANLSNLGLVTNSNEDLALTLTSGGVNGGTTSIRVGTSSPHNVITPEHVGQLYFQTEQGTAGLWQSLSTASSGWRRYLFDFGIGGDNQVLISGGSARVNSFPAMTYDSTLQQLQIRGSESQGTTGYSLRDNLGNEGGGLQYDQSNSLITLFSKTDGYIVGDWEVPVGSTLSAQPPIDSNHVVIKDYLDENTGNYLVVDAQGEITITVNAALYGNRSPDKTHLFINCRGNGTKTIVLSSETIMLGQIITVSKTWASSSIIIEPPAGVLFERTTGIRTIVGLTEGNRSFTFAYLSPINGYSIINNPRFGISANSVLGNTSSSNELPNGISYNTNSLLLRGSGNLAVTDVPDGYLIGRPTGGELGSHSLSDFDIVTIQDTFHGGSSNISWNDSTRKVELKGDNFITSGYVLQTSDNQYRGSFQYNQTNNELSISASGEINAAYIYGNWEVPIGSTLSAQEPTEDGHVVTKEYLEAYVQNDSLISTGSRNITINDNNKTIIHTGSPSSNHTLTIMADSHTLLPTGFHFRVLIGNNANYGISVSADSGVTVYNIANGSAGSIGDMLFVRKIGADTWVITAIKH